MKAFSPLGLLLMVVSFFLGMLAKIHFGNHWETVVVSGVPFAVDKRTGFMRSLQPPP